jgi:primase-polymerase (primpol)-like protein
LPNALDAHRRGEYDSIGITLGDIGDGRIRSGLDLDDCRDPESGDVAEWALWTTRQLDSYAEVSPSATGLKALPTSALALVFQSPSEDRFPMVQRRLNP